MPSLDKEKKQVVSTNKNILRKISEISIKYDWIEISEDLSDHLSVEYDNPLDIAKKLSNAPRMKNFFGQARIEFEQMLAIKEEEYNNWYAQKLALIEDSGTQKERERVIKERYNKEFKENFGIMQDLKKYIKQLELAEECFRYQERALNGISGMMYSSLRNLSPKN